MKRILVSVMAVLIANFAAPLLFALVILISSVLDRPEAFSWNAAFRLIALFGVFGAVPVLRLAFPISLMLAVTGLCLGWQSRRIYLGGGALIGLLFFLILQQKIGYNDSKYFAVSVPIGVVCGWIYWRIAIGKTPEPLRAIDPA